MEDNEGDAMNGASTSDSGFAMVFVLIGLSLLSILFASAIQAIYLPQVTFAALRSATLKDVDLARANALLRPAIAEAMAAEDPSAGGLPRFDGTPFDLPLGQRTLRVALQDEGGLVDLNAAEDAILLAFLVRVDPERGREAAGAILEARAESVLVAREAALRSSGLSGAALDHAMRMSTVKSGQRRLNPRTVATELVDLFGFGDADSFASAQPEFFQRVRVRSYRLTILTNTMR